MKKGFYILIMLLLFLSCEKPSDCVKSTGPMTSKVYEALSFKKILVNKGIGVVITEGENYKVEVRTGENLINDIKVSVAGDMLTLTDDTTCNWTRDYGETVVYITAPNLTDIYSKTEQNILSQGALSYENLRLIATDKIDGFNGVGTGNFILQLQTGTSLTIENNTVGSFYLTGTAAQMTVKFYEGGGVIHAETLLANHIHVYHRGTNDMFLHPVNAITGDIYNSGNIYSVTHPETVQVIEHYRGKLIFN